MLTGIDYFVVIAYLASILLLGYYFRKFVSSSDDFLLGGCEALVTKVPALGPKYQNHFKQIQPHNCLIKNIVKTGNK